MVLGAIRARKLNILSLKDQEQVNYPLDLAPVGKMPYFEKVCSALVDTMITSILAPRVFNSGSVEEPNGPFHGSPHGSSFPPSKVDGPTGNFTDRKQFCEFLGSGNQKRNGRANENNEKGEPIARCL